MMAQHPIPEPKYADRFEIMTPDQIATYGQIRGVAAALDEAIRAAKIAGFHHSVIQPIQYARNLVHDAMQAAERGQS